MTEGLKSSFAGFVTGVTLAVGACVVGEYASLEKTINDSLYQEVDRSVAAGDVCVAAGSIIVSSLAETTERMAEDLPLVSELDLIAYSENNSGVIELNKEINYRNTDNIDSGSLQVIVKPNPHDKNKALVSMRSSNLELEDVYSESPTTKSYFSGLVRLSIDADRHWMKDFNRQIEEGNPAVALDALSVELWESGDFRSYSFTPTSKDSRHHLGLEGCTSKNTVSAMRVAKEVTTSFGDSSKSILDRIEDLAHV